MDNSSDNNNYIPLQWRIQDYELGGGRDSYTQAEGLCDEAAGFAGGGMEGGVPPPRLAKMKLILVVFCGYVKWIWGGGGRGGPISNS